MPSPSKSDSDEEGIFEVDKILARRGTETAGFEYLTHWRGFDDDDDTWEPASSFEGCEYVIQEFHDTFNGTPEEAEEEDVELEEEEGTPAPITNKSVATFCEILADSTDEIFTTAMINVVRKLQSNGEIHLLPVSQVSSLLSSGAACIRDASRNIFFAEENPDAAAETSEMSSNCRNLLHRVNIVRTMLRILTADKISRRLSTEEIVKDIYEFAWFHTQNHVFPLYDEAAYNNSPVAKKLAALGVDKEDENLTASAKKKSKKKNESTCASYYRMLQPFRLLQQFSEIWDLISQLVSRSRLQDGLILRLTDNSLQSMTLAGVEAIQFRVLPLLVAVYRDYPAHRGHIVNEIVNTLVETASLPKRSIFTFSVSQDETIMMLSALLMQLVQGLSCEQTWEGQQLGDQCEASASIAVLTAIKKESSRFVDRIFMRCTEKFDKLDSGSSFLSRVQNLVEDLLTIWQRPEWISAEWFLNRILQCVMHVFIDKDGEHKLRQTAIKNGCDAVIPFERLTETLDTKQLNQQLSQYHEMRKFCLTIGGMIVAKMKSTTLAFLALPQSSFLKELAQDENDEKEEHLFAGEIRCSCCKLVTFSEDQLSQKIVETFGGNVLADGSWVDFSRQACLDCQIRISIQQQIEESSTMQEIKVDDLASKDHLLMLRQLLLNYFQTQTDVELVNAGQCHTLQWLTDLDESDPTQQDFIFQLKNDERSSQQDKDKRHVVLSYEHARQACSVLSEARITGVDQSLTSATVIDGIVMLLQDDLPIIRARAIKSIKVIVDADQSVLRQPNVRIVLEKCIHDRNISVREASLDVMGNHMLSSPDLIDVYYSVIADRVRDVGTSVRKRAVQIFHGIVTKWPDIPKATDLFSTLVKCIADDEESIKKLVLKTFADLWFAGLKHMRVSTVAQQIVAVVVASNSEIDWLKTVISEVSNGLANPKEVQKVCAALCSELVEKIGQNDDLEHICHHLAVLSLFGSVKGGYVARHISVLQVYLADTRLSSSGDPTAQKIISFIANIISCGIPCIQSQDIMMLESIEKSLGVILISTGRSTEALEASTRCLCTLVNCGTSNYQLIEELLQRFYLFSDKNTPDPERQDAIELGTRGLIRRYLYMMGVLCRFHDFDANYEGRDSVAFGDERNGDEDTKRLKVGEVCMEVFRVLYRYFISHDGQFQRWALQSMGSLFCRNPKLILTKAANKVFTAAFNASDVSLRSQHLANIVGFLESQMEDMSKGQADEKCRKKGSWKKTKDADSGMSSALIQQYLKPILAACLDKEEVLRKHATNIIQHIVCQSFVAPFQCVPHLIALCSDPIAEIQNMSFSLLQTIHEKRPEFCADMHAISGVWEAYHFRLRLSNMTEEAMAMKLKDAFVGVKKLYSLLRPNRPRRMNFLQSLVTKIGTFHDDSVQNPSLSFYVFLAQQVTNLPFVVREEPLFIIYTISHILALHRDSILHELSKEVEDGVQPAPAHQVKMNDAAAICILILIKHHLKEVHYISDSVCEDFKPSVGSKAIEKNLPHFNEREDPVLNLQSVYPLLLAETPDTRETAYTLLKELVHNDLHKDFEYDKGKKRRKTTTPGDNTPGQQPNTNSRRGGKGSGSGKRASAKKQQTTKKKRAKKKLKMLSTDEEEDDDDDSDF